LQLIELHAKTGNLDSALSQCERILSSPVVLCDETVQTVKLLYLQCLLKSVALASHVFSRVFHDLRKFFTIAFTLDSSHSHMHRLFAQKMMGDALIHLSRLPDASIAELDGLVGSAIGSRVNAIDRAIASFASIVRSCGENAAAWNDLGLAILEKSSISPANHENYQR
jgi:hypothetical protein